jgi:hypothetical protein
VKVAAGGVDWATVAGPALTLFVNPHPPELRPLLDVGGFTRLVCRVQWMGMDQRVVLRTIALLAERVLPLLRRDAVAPKPG